MTGNENRDAYSPVALHTENNPDSVRYIKGIRYELKRRYAGKFGALEWAAEVRKNGYYPNRKGLARVYRLTDGWWGVFVGYGGYRS